MFVIFGCEKKPTAVEPLLDTHCYQCNQTVTWNLFSETEWLSFFFINTLKIKSEHHLVCERCGDEHKLDKKTYKLVENRNRLNQHHKQQLHDDLVDRLEKHQLEGKTEAQLQFIRNLKNEQSNEH